MARHGTLRGGLDIGTSKVCTVVGELLDEGGVDVIGIGVAESKGLKRGVVVNLDAAVESIKKSIEEAELMAGVEVGSVHLAISGPHIKGFNSRGVVAVGRQEPRGHARRRVRRRSMRRGRCRCRPAARSSTCCRRTSSSTSRRASARRSGSPAPGSRSTSTSSPAASHRDAEPGGVRQPRRRRGDRHGDRSAGRGGSGADADEKELGVALVDIGGGTADLAIFERGSLWHTAVIAVGGDHFTNDIAVGLRTPIPDAEKIKRRAGCALSSMVEEDETIEVASVGGRRPRVMARRILSDILQPRAEEIFHLVWDEISKAGYEKSLNSGLVLTGGGAQLDGMSEIAEQIFDLPIRRGSPVGVGGLADHVANPAYATAVGLVLYAARHRAPDAPASAAAR